MKMYIEIWSASIFQICSSWFYTPSLRCGLHSAAAKLTARN